MVFGSFVTSKPAPQDVDLFLVMTDAFDASELTGDMRLLFDHGAAQAHVGASGSGSAVEQRGQRSESR